MPNDLIPLGARVRATLHVDADSVGTAQLYIADGDGHDETSIPPGVDGAVSITAEREGQLRVVVSAGPDTAGTLTVTPGGVEDRPVRSNHEERFTVAELDR